MTESRRVSVYVSPDRDARTVHYLDLLDGDWQFRCMPLVPVGQVLDRDSLVNCVACLAASENPRPERNTTAPGTGPGTSVSGEAHDGSPAIRCTACGSTAPHHVQAVIQTGVCVT